MTVSGITDGAAIAAIGGTACAVRDSGEVWCWGDGRMGQTGDGAMVERSAPVRVLGLKGLTVQGISQAINAFHARIDDGRVFCWGQHGFFYCGLREQASVIPTAREVPDLMGATDIEGSCAILASGAHVCWGANFSGRLGLGTFDNPIDRVTPTGWSGLDGLGDGCVLVGGGIRCAGSNRYRQVGDQTSTDRDTYVQPAGLP